MGEPADGIEILAVTVVTRAFPARPSAIPGIREFVRQQLTLASRLSDDVRALDRSVADLLLDAAVQGGTIQVSLRIFDDRAELDMLYGSDVGDSPRLVPAVRAPMELTPVESLPPPPAYRAAGSFADWLAAAIRSEGMTLETAARELKVSVKTVSRWIRGATEPRLGDLTRIRERFGDLPFSDLERSPQP